MKYVVILIIFLLGFTNLKSQTLTNQQKLDDFEYLYDVLNQNFPLFEVSKRKKGIDWLGQKHNFIEKIGLTKTDKEYFILINDIINSLNNGHVDLMPTFVREKYIESYQKFSSRKRWVQELEKGNNYWTDLFKFKIQDGLESKYDYDSTNVSFSYYKNKSIAVLKIKSFVDQFFEKDKNKLIKFLQGLNSEKVLIIDLQGNGGGTESYWRECIVPYIYHKRVQYNSIPLVLRNGDFVTSFFDDDFKKRKVIKNKKAFLNKYPQTPNEVLKKDFNIYVERNKSSIKSKRLKRFDGKIYLLVDDGVFSSAESFAIFSKISNCAQVAGTYTKGDGGSFDPVLICLPNSKIIVRFSAVMSLNPDGSSNAEKGTKPNIFIDGKNQEERLINLINFVSK